MKPYDDDSLRHLERLMDGMPKRAVELEMALFEWQNRREQELNTVRMNALTDIVSGIAHELSTPVGIGVTVTSYLKQLNAACRDLVVGGSTEDLEQKFAEAARGLELLERSLERVVDDLDKLKKLTVQRNPAYDQVNLKKTIEQILTTLASDIKDADCELNLDIAPELNVGMGPEILSEIIGNLVQNSLTHGFSGRSGNRIEIRGFEEAGDVFIHFSDNGRGILPENLSRIFDPFYTTRRCEGRIGLGLNIVYNLVTHALDGTITCSSRPGKGTAFEVHLPHSVD